MTTPNINFDLYMPKTYVFERKNQAYANLAFMTRQGKALDYVYLPKGLSSITVTATGFGPGRARVWLFGSGGYIAPLTDMTGIGATTERLWMGQLSSPGERSDGLWLKIQLQNITTQGMNNGSVAVQIINFPPEN